MAVARANAADLGDKKRARYPMRYIGNINEKWWDFLAFAVIFLAITISSISPLSSGKKLNYNDDFLQYAGRYEAVRKSLVEYHTFPTRSHWLGGGYPTLGDPEDPTLNPLIVFPLLFGTVTGLKVITYVALLIGGFGAYAFARYFMSYTRWGSLFVGLAFGLSLFMPGRIQDGNPNELYPCFLPICMMLIGFVCRGRKIAFLILPFIFYIMLSDGKLCALMAIMYIGIFCLLDLIPPFRIFKTQSKVDFKPLKVLFLALVMTFFIGMVRYLPAFELISGKGGLKHIDLYFAPKTYKPDSVPAYKFEELWQEAVSWKDKVGLVTMGWVPIGLFAIALPVFWRKSLPWGINLLLFTFLLLAHNAPVDLLKLLWNLPIFNVLYRPYKYFSFQIVFTIAFASGQVFWLLKKLHYKWVEHIIAIGLIIGSVWFLYPKMAKVQKETYTYNPPAELANVEEKFFNIKGKGIVRNRKEPVLAITYYNVVRNIGTIDWHTGIPIDENSIPKYFVGEVNEYVPNPEYRGEAFFLNAENAKVESEISPHSIKIRVDTNSPGTLMVNQNYHRDWHTNKGKIFSKDGLIALELQETGSYTVSLRYISRSFYMGLAVSLLSLGILTFLCWSYKTGRPRYVNRVVLWLTK